MESTWITTGGGDKGKTSLGNGERVPKDAPRVILYGTLDECQAAIGMARATCCEEGIQKQLFTLEENLGFVMGYFALYPGLPEPNPETLEHIVDKAKEVVGETFRFVRPGDSEPGAALHLARTIARRAERMALPLYRNGDIGDPSYTYVNRLSDAIYALSLWTDYVNSGCGKEGS
ncbi:MAG: cob(I)yrinic acid a,c-diamide adenosyltransferase [Synergistales bacterium]|nr:cob(I)yrinic acid a,c-diamide adenosyltransferase [Synergistales bacterium]